MSDDAKMGVALATIGLLFVGAGAGVGAVVGGKKHRVSGAVVGGLIVASGVGRVSQYDTPAPKRRSIAMRPSNPWIERDRHSIEAKSDDAPRPMTFGRRSGRGQRKAQSF